MQNMTMDVLIAIIQSNLAAHMGKAINPEMVKDICGTIRESLEHHKKDDASLPP